MIDAILAGLLAGYGIAMPVGAITVLIVTLTAHTSLSHGLAAAMGAATADGLYALAAVVAGATLTRIAGPMIDPLQLIAAIILIAIAAKGIFSAVRNRQNGTVPLPMEGASLARIYGSLLALTVLNPLTLVYFGAMVLGNQSTSGSIAAGLVFVVAAFIASASWQGFLALGGSLIGRTLTSNRGRLATAVIGNLLIAILAVKIAWSILE